ncbi:PKD domain-containing protein [Candidatus Bathyarchaeota archaeon A05DMB-2]|jgi:parallel beta-helix repeat protein|nr:PKD domain-containing protein [Candidatus Bathyarchaeota archaeon A05DMB-2]
MNRKAVSGIILTLLLTSVLVLMFNVRIAASNPETLSIKVTWQQKMDMPTARGSLFRGRSAIGEKIYVIGGWNGNVLNIVEIYNIDEDMWIAGTPLPAPRLDGAVQVIDSKLYVIGGNSHGGGGAVSTVWEYDPILDVWASKSSMPTGRRSLASAVVDGKIYAISGVDTGNMISTAVEVYDPATDTWQIKSAHPLPRQYLTAEAVSGKIYTFGGNEYSNRVHEYDPVLDEWTEKSPMPLYVSSPNSVAIGDKIFIVGGSGSESVMMYDPATDHWAVLLDSLPTQRFGALTAEVYGKIYVIGGSGPSGYSAANEEGTITVISTPPKTIIVPDDYPTIQEAINNASNGDTVYVRQGIYFENIILNKTISLVGENKTMTIINGNMTGTTVIVKAYNATIKEFTITNGTNGGLVIFGSSEIIVANNVVTNNYGPKYSYYFSGAGIIASNSMNCIITQNLVSSNDETAIEIRSSNNITVDANNIDRNGGGIFISGSSGCILRRNNITGHRLNFGVYGWGLSSYIHDIDSSNTINGKPILYLINRQHLQINPTTFPEVGYLALINSTNIVLKDFVFKENYQGILLIATNNSAIQNVIVSNNTYGIHSFYSGGNEITDCITSGNWEGIFMRYSKTGNIFINLTASNNYEGLFIGDCGYINITNSNISKNEGYGIYLTACYYGENNISHNIIANNTDGIRLDFSPSLLRENMIVNNDVGLWLFYSKNSTIFHNSFMNNIKQVHYEYSTPTNWDDGYPSGGNYWSDYAGVDEKSGLNQDQPGSDGIGDIPYQIPILDTWGGIIGYDYDNYPLMKPWGTIKMVLDVIWDDIIYPVTVVSNSTIDDFNFSQPLKQISFNVAGPDGTIGFCNVIIPKALLYGEPWTVLIDGAPVLPTIFLTENATHSFLYLTYTHSTHRIQIIGTWVIGPPPPTYSLTITTTVGGTTDPAPGTYSYTASSTVEVTAIPEANYLFDYWELDSVNVGSANPYTVLMDKDHTLKAVFSLIPPPLSASISPPSASILVGQSVIFTSTVSGGYTPYSYQWYLNGNPVSGATSASWTFTPTASGIYYVHLKVTDAKGNTAQSDTARITAASVPVGGYSIPIQGYSTAKPLTPYLTLIAILTIALATIKRKTPRKTKKPP